MSALVGVAHEVPTPHGAARLTLVGNPGAGRVLIGHGAGGASWPADLQALGAAAVAAGWQAVFVDQPWRVAGKKVAGPPAHLDAAWLAVVESLDSDGVPLVAAGRSAGARVACRTAERCAARGVIAVSFPLHPPGRPDRSRAEEALEPGRHGIPILVIHGDRDPFGSPAEFEAALPDTPRVVVAGAHSLTLAATVAMVQQQTTHFLLTVGSG